MSRITLNGRPAAGRPAADSPPPPPAGMPPLVLFGGVVPVAVPGLWAGAVRFTPEAAAAWLARSTRKNRCLGENNLAALSGAMSAGEFVLNGETVVVDTAGDLLNGHHRLQACVDTGRPFDTVLVAGIDPGVFHTFDTGKFRGKRDVLQVDGLNAPANLTAIARLVWLHEKGELHRLRETDARVGWTNKAAVEFVRSREDLATAAQLGRAAYRQYPALSGSHHGFLEYVLPAVDQAQARAFLDRLQTGAGLEAGEPVFILRRLLDNHRASRARRPGPDILAFCLLAWRHHCRGARPLHLRFTATDPFPSVNPWE